MQLISISAYLRASRRDCLRMESKQICLCLGKVSLGLQLSSLVCLYISGRLQVT